MANAHDTYVIERDERDLGGEITVIAIYEDYQTALAVWEKVAVPVNEKITMWFLRRIGGSADLGKTVVIDCKCK